MLRLNTNFNEFLNLKDFSYNKFFFFGNEPALFVKTKNHSLIGHDLRLLEKVYLNLENEVGNFLKKSVNNIRGENVKAREFRKELNSSMEKLAMDKSFLSRYVNDGFSGGEKKRLEMLQMMLLNPSLALLDETDSGLDIDALRLVASGVNEIAKDTGILVITHYQRLLDLVKPDFVHAMIDGKFVKSGGPELAHKLEKQGYDWLEA